MFYTIFGGLIWTISLTLTALIVGIIFGVGLCFMRTSGVLIYNVIAQSLILLFRSVPPIVWLFIIYFGIGSAWIETTPFQAAAIGLGLITAANMSEIIRGSLTAIHKGQWEATRALNLPPFYRLHDIIIPQVIRISLPSTVSYAIGLLKDTAIASTIGVPEIAFHASHEAQVTFKGLESFAIAGLLYILLSIPTAWIARIADQRLRAKVAR